MQWINALKELLFPRYCKVCGRRLTHSEQHLCISCLLELPRTHYDKQPNNLLMQRFLEWPQIQRATAYFFYHKEGKSSNLIHHIKYYDHPETGTYLAAIAAKEIKSSGFFNDIDVIVPVPLSKKKLCKRGYNQCDYIAQGLKNATGITVCNNCIERIIDTDTQTLKNRTARWENTESIFQVTEPSVLKGKHILLIDDVTTTGATLHACISAILTVKDVRISIFTLAKAI